MKLWIFVCGIFVAGTVGCSDRLAQIQQTCQGTWVLESRELPDGTRLLSPKVSGMLVWAALDSRKAYVTIHVEIKARDTISRKFDYATSVYEVSTSAITRKRHLLIRQGYHSSSKTPLRIYTRERTSKGKITLEENQIKMAHTLERGSYSDAQNQEFIQIYKGDTMFASIPGVFSDTWKKINTPIPK